MEAEFNLRFFVSEIEYLQRRNRDIDGEVWEMIKTFEGQVSPLDKTYMDRKIKELQHEQSENLSTSLKYTRLCENHYPRDFNNYKDEKNCHLCGGELS